jgi:Protein of unknown function (DUF3575)
MKKITILATVLTLFTINLKADDLKLDFKPEKTHSILRRGGDRGGDGIKGKLMINAGVGINLLTTNLRVRYALSTAYNNAGTLPTFKETPMMNVGADYGLARKISVGVAFGYQTATGTYNDGYFAFQDHWTRIHMAARFDYHIVANENMSLYTGAKLGYNIYKVTSTYDTDPTINATYISELSPPSAISAQVHFGFSYWFAHVFGVNAEVGVGYGGPYLLAVGVTAKI